jgi:hypothetical protein
MKRRLTCRRGFDRYKSDGLVCAIQLDHVEADEVEHAVITESDERWIDDVGRTIIRQRRDSHYLVGEIANRLYEYEQLGYSPEELKEIVDLYKGRKERLNALYGAAAIDTDQLSMHHPYIYVGRCNGKSLMQAKAIFEYLKNDVEFTKTMVNGHFGVPKTNFDIKDVIFNDPATIVFWDDGTKTVVKADKEDFDPEKGLAMAISKKALGNKGNYFDIFKKWTSKYKRPVKELDLLGSCGDDICKGFADGMRQAAEAARKLAMETRDDAVEGNLFLASDELRGVLNRKRATKNDMVKSIRYALERLDHARLHFIKKKEN